ncbi:MAG: hypothetical protein QXD62_03190 [Candidatus Woesearchaeota archaeon]
MKKLSLGFFCISLFFFIIPLGFSFSLNLSNDNISIIVNYCKPHIEVILNSTIDYYFLYDSFGILFLSDNASKNFTSLFGEIGLQIENQIYTIYSNISVINRSISVPSQQYINFSLYAEIGGAIKSAKLRISDFEEDLTIDYKPNVKKSVITFSKKYSFDFENPELVYEDFCNSTYVVKLNTKFFSKDPNITLDVEKKVYSSNEVISLFVNSDYDSWVNVTDSNGNLLIGPISVVKNTPLKISLSQISVTDYRKIKIVAYNSHQAVSSEIFIYSPDKYICEILDNLYYRNQLNNIKISTNAKKAYLYQYSTLISSCNSSICQANLQESDPLRLVCVFEADNFEFNISHEKSFNFTVKTYYLNVNVYDVLTKELINDARITVRNKNTNFYKIFYSGSIEVSVVRGIYEIEVSAQNYEFQTREIMVDKDMVINFYLESVRNVSPMELLIFEKRTFSDLVSVKGQVINANYCEFYEGKDDYFRKLQDVNPLYFDIRFKGIFGFDYYLICYNLYSRELFLVFKEFDRQQVRILQQDELKNVTVQENRIPLIELLDTTKYLKDSFISLSSFYRGLEQDLMQLIEKMYYNDFVEETKFLKELNDIVVNFLSDLGKDGISFNISNSFLDLINIFDKIEAVETNIKRLYQSLGNESTNLEFDANYFSIPEKVKKHLAFLDTRIPTKLHISKFEYVPLDYGNIEEMIEYKCLVDRVYVTSYFRENRSSNTFYRVSCPINPAIIVFDDTYVIMDDIVQKYFNKLPKYAFVPKDLSMSVLYFSKLKQEEKTNILSIITGRFLKVINKNRNTIFSIFLVLVLIFVSIFGFTKFSLVLKEAIKKKTPKSVSKPEIEKDKLKEKLLLREDKKQQQEVQKIPNFQVQEKEKKTKKRKIKEIILIQEAILKLNKIHRKMQNSNFEEKKKFYKLVLEITNKIDPLVSDMEFAYATILDDEIKKEIFDVIEEYKNIRAKVLEL